MDKHQEATGQPAPPPYSANTPYPSDPSQQPPAAPGYSQQTDYNTQYSAPTTQYGTQPPPAQYGAPPPTQPFVAGQPYPTTGPPGQQYPPGQPGAPPPMAPGGAWQQTPQGPAYVTHTTTVRNTGNVDSGTFKSLRTAIPELPMGVAITLCVINCILPGIGTIIAGFCVFCCGNPGQSGGGKFGTFCINFWIGIAQIVTLIFFVGWIWSIMWGVAFIAISDEGQRKRKGNTTTTTVTTTTVPGVYPAQPAHVQPK